MRKVKRGDIIDLRLDDYKDLEDPLRPLIGKHLMVDSAEANGFVIILRLRDYSTGKMIDGSPYGLGPHQWLFYEREFSVNTFLTEAHKAISKKEKHEKPA